MFARIKLVEACYQIIKSKKKTASEEVFVRDTAEELLEQYAQILSDSEKKSLQSILEDLKGS